MISHVVLLTPRPDLSVEERKTFVSAFRHAISAIPTVGAVRIARRLVHGAGYEEGTPGAGFLVIIDFADLAALQTYLRHPAHAELSSRFSRSLTWAQVYDFELLTNDRGSDVMDVLEKLVDGA